jgi:predicted metal-binding membrane protein
MEAARLPRAAGRVEPRQLALVAGMLGLAVVGWLITADRMAGMDMGPGTDPGTLGFFVSTWVVMMGAMMFPSVSPLVVTFKRLQAARREKGMPAAAGATAALLAGYLVAWTGAGLVGFALLAGGRALGIDALSWDNAGPYVAGGVILAAAVYQLTPLKDACLTRCRGPLSFLIERWRDGRAGALRMGFVHGAWCVGCCWALMAALFALGAMSLLWMAVVAAFIALEKLLPWRAGATGAVTALLVVLALAVAFAPDEVPGLTTPDGTAMPAGEAMPAADGMQMRMEP